MAIGSRVSEGLETKEEIEGYKGEFDDIKSQFKEWDIPFLKPVAGPLVFRFFFLVCCLASVGLFGFSVYQNIDTWSDNVVTVEETVVDEIEYPDIFFCVPPDTNYMLQNGFDGAYLHPEYYDTTTGNPPLSQNGELEQSATHNCAVTLMDDSYRVIRGCAADIISEGTAGADAGDVAKITALKNARKRDLKGAVMNGYRTDGPGTTEASFPTGTEVEPLCSMFKMRDVAKAKRALGDPKYLVFNGHLRVPGTLVANNWHDTGKTTSNTKGNGDRLLMRRVGGSGGFDPSYTFVESYTVKRGESPINADGDITANMDMVPFVAHMAIVDITTRKVKDETRGDDEFKYMTDTTGFSMRIDEFRDCTAAGEDSDSCYKLVLVYKITDFKIEEITIRNYKPSEVFASIGGIWAGALFIIALFFSPSGRINKNGKELQVFKYLPNSWRKKHLKGHAEKQQEETGL